MRRHHVGTLFVMVAALAGGACATASSDEPAGGASSAIGAGGACMDYARVYCGRLEACAGGYFFPTEYTDRAACEQSQAERCTRRHAAPGIAIPATELGPCVTAIEEQACADVLSRRVPEACGTRGSLTDGSACGDDAQCATGFCAGPRQGCGTCAVPPARGERCVRGRCGPDESCGGDPFAPRCLARVEIGKPCGWQADALCRFGLVCVADRCAPGLPEGASCRAGGSEGDPECDRLQGLWCNGFAPQARCVRPRHVAIGEVCGFNDYATNDGLMFDPSTCLGDGRCPLYDGPGGEGPPRCSPRGAEGAACDDRLADVCLTDLVCKAGSCVRPDPSSCHLP